ncbi:MAG: GPR endopeptidase [Clostridiales bacterium]|nr:GPR endopeptidase [Clostridiales bacterium]
MPKFSIRTDLACESEATHDAGKDGTAYAESDVNGFRVAKLHVRNADGEAAAGKPCGRYVTVFTKLLCDESAERLDALAALIAAEIDALAKLHLGGTPRCVLVAGLGNREITADSIGPKTVDRLTVTRHIREHDEALFNSYFRVPLCAIAPGVLGQTGIETAELVGGVAKTARPDLILAVDALAARATERLGATVQISDSGIFPGSGIGNRRSEISMRTLGVPVIAIGVPTVVNSATLVYDALQSAGYTEVDDRMERVLHEGESFFVSPRQSDRISESVADMLADAIDRLCLYERKD